MVLDFMSYFDYLINEYCAFPGDKSSNYIKEQEVCVQHLQSGSLDLKSSIPT